MVFICSPFQLLIYILGETFSLHRFGRGNFQESMKLVTRADDALVDWSKFRYMVFDMPNHTGTYQERYGVLGILYFGYFFFFKWPSHC